MLIWGWFGTRERALINRDPALDDFDFAGMLCLLPLGARNLLHPVRHRVCHFERIWDCKPLN